MKSLILFTLLLFSATARAEEAPLTILAASSLREVLTEVGALFEKESGWPVRFIFAASGNLARQIEQGAPADIFISDSRDELDQLAGAGLIDPATREHLGGNRLVVVQPAPYDVFAQEPADLLRVSRIAVGDPTTDPAGRYAQQFLEKHGLWTQLLDRLVFADNVRAALALAERDEVGAALVFTTDVRTVTSDPGVRVSFTVDQDQHAPILYEAAILSGAPRRVAALKFFWVLETPEAKAAWARLGFTPP